MRRTKDRAAWFVAMLRLTWRGIRDVDFVLDSDRFDYELYALQRRYGVRWHHFGEARRKRFAARYEAEHR